MAKEFVTEPIKLSLKRETVKLKGDNFLDTTETSGLRYSTSDRTSWSNFNTYIEPSQNISSKPQRKRTVYKLED